MAVLFDGGSDRYLNAESPAALDNIFAGGGTVSFWFNAAGYGEISFGRIFFKGSDASNDASTQLFLINSTGQKELKLYRSWDGANGQWTITPIELDTWYNFVVTYNEDSVANNPIMYLNGVSKTVTEAVTPSGSVVSDAANNLYIGSRVTDREFDGRIAEVAIWDVILTADEAAILSKGYSPLFVRPQNLVAYWPLIRESIT